MPGEVSWKWASWIYFYWMPKSDFRKHFGNVLSIKNDFMDGEVKARWCRVRRITKMRKDVLATGPFFHLDNVRVVNTGVGVWEADTFREVSAPFGFESLTQFL